MRRIINYFKFDTRLCCRSAFKVYNMTGWTEATLMCPYPDPGRGVWEIEIFFFMFEPFF